MYDRHGHCPTLTPHQWQDANVKGTDALLSAIENADGDSVELSMVPDRVSEAERIDREMKADRMVACVRHVATTTNISRGLPIDCEAIDREMEQRGGLLRAVEPPLVQGGQGRTGEEVSLTSILTVALIAIGVIAIALGVDQILAIVGGA